MRKLLILLFTTMLLIFVSCGSTDDYTCTLVAPQGAPAVAVANLAKDDENISFIGGDLVSEQFTANDKDFIIAPINLGANLYSKNKSTYKLAAVITWGNLYFATLRDDVDEVADFEGKEITFFGQNTINYSVAKYVLSGYNYTEPTTNNETYTAGTAAGTAALLTDAEKQSTAIVLTAEPILSATSTKLAAQGKTVKTFSVQKLFSEKTNGSSFTQAGLFVKADTLKDHKSVVDNYLTKIEESCSLVSNDLDSVINIVIELGNVGVPSNANVLKNALPKSNIKFVLASDAKASVEATANIDISKFGGALPVNEFYYSK